MTYRIITRGHPRPVAHDFRCEIHGVFVAVVDPDLDAVPCPAQLPATRFGEQRCGISSPWSPQTAPPMRMRRVEATRGQHEKAEHKGWCDTSNVEEGQKIGDWRDDRDAVAEELRKEMVVEAVRSDR